MAPILVPQPATSAIALLAAPARTLIVTTAADIVDPGDGKLSLREAVAKANATASLDAIEFAPSLEGKTLVLTGGPLVVSHDLVIDGDRNNDGVAVTLSGGGKQRILVTSGADTDLGLRDLKLTKGFGKDLDGGAIFVDGGSLSMSRCSIRDSVASGPYYAPPGNGGAIFAADGSRLTIIDSELIGNSANISGGAISATVIM